MSLRVIRPGWASQKKAFSTVAAVKPAEWEAARPYEEIPGPKPIPLLGNKHLFLPGLRKYDFSDMTQAYGKIQKDYGNIARFSGMEPRRDMVVVYDANDIETVFRAEGLWPVRPPLSSMQYYRTVHRKDFFKGVGGLINDQGEPWHKTRTLVNPVMMQPKTAKHYAPGINKVAEDFVVKIPGWKDGKNELPDNFKNELYKWALESIALIALDTRLGCLEPNLAADSVPQKAIDTIQQIFTDLHTLEMKSFLWLLITTPTLKRFLKSSDVLLEISYNYIQEAMKKYEGKPKNEESGVLEKFLERDPDPTRAIIMALDMIFAGVDTTSYALANALLHLSANQDKQDILYEELKRLLPSPDTPIDYEMLNEMKYLRACVKESMRIAPIAQANARTSQAEIVLGGYQIPKNVDILFPHGLLSLMKSHYPEPERFLPERWIRGGEHAHKAHPFVTLPFGHGARKCVGVRFASMELEMMLAKMVRRFHWDFKYFPMQYETAILCGPANPLKFTVSDR